jgi:peroxiredoxin Q/BCP
MTQLRQDYDQFVARDAVVLAVDPDSLETLRQWWEEHHIPIVGLPDPGHLVADLYGQEVSLLRLGRMPALFVIDKAGQVRLQHYGSAMDDIPHNADVLALLDTLNQTQDANRG